MAIEHILNALEKTQDPANRIVVGAGANILSELLLKIFGQNKGKNRTPEDIYQCAVALQKAQRDFAMVERGEAVLDGYKIVPVRQSSDFPTRDAWYENDNPIAGIIQTVEENSKLQRVKEFMTLEEVELLAYAEAFQNPISDDEEVQIPNPDWFADWRSKARHASNDEVKLLFAKVLNEQIKGNHISLRTIDLITKLSKEEAQLIENISGLVFASYIFPFSGFRQGYTEFGINEKKFNWLKELGLFAAEDETIRFATGEIHLLPQIDERMAIKIDLTDVPTHVYVHVPRKTSKGSFKVGSSGPFRLLNTNYGVTGLTSLSRLGIELTSLAFNGTSESERKLEMCAQVITDNIASKRRRSESEELPKLSVDKVVGKNDAGDYITEQRIIIKPDENILRMNGF